ncbi:hypothetical protein ACP4OV_029539 [Aristida adscensionis]
MHGRYGNSTVQPTIDQQRSSLSISFLIQIPDSRGVLGFTPAYSGGAQMAKPTLVLVPVGGVGHFEAMLEVGKRLLAQSGHALAITVLIMPEPVAKKWTSEIAELVRKEEASGLDIRFHRLPAADPPTDHTGIEEYISRYVQRYAPHVRAAVAGLACPVAAVVVDIFCTALFDAAHELAVPAYVYMISSAAMCALMLRSPALDEEAGDSVEFEEAAEGGVDVPGLPPVPASCLPMGLENRKISTYQWFLYNGRRYMEANGIIVNTVAELEPGVLEAIAAGRCTRWTRAPPVYTIKPLLPLIPASRAAYHFIKNRRSLCTRRS